MSEPAGRAGFLRALQEGPLLADAAMGTRLIAQGLDLGSDDPALWNLTHPEAVAEIHRRDRAAGAQVLLTNTFGANPAWMARFGSLGDVAAINHRGVELALDVARMVLTQRHPPVFVLGSIGPTAAGSPGAYEQQIEALAEAGVEGLWFETHRLEAALEGLNAACRLTSLPLIVTLNEWPEPLAWAAARLGDAGACALGGNCMLGMNLAAELARRLHAVTDLPLVIKPSAGVPGSPIEAPASFAGAVPALLGQGVRLLGGCCGSDDRHIAALAGALRAERPA